MQQQTARALALTHRESRREQEIRKPAPQSCGSWGCKSQSQNRSFSGADRQSNGVQSYGTQAQASIQQRIPPWCVGGFREVENTMWFVYTTSQRYLVLFKWPSPDINRSTMLIRTCGFRQHFAHLFFCRSQLNNLLVIPRSPVQIP